MMRLWLRLEDFVQLDDEHRSGDFVDIGDNVYHILDYHFVSDHAIGYPPTIAGYALWICDTIGEWLTVRKCRLIRWLSWRGFAYVPEGCEPAWFHIGKKSPVKAPMRKVSA